MFYESFISADDFDNLLLELYADSNIDQLIVYETDDEKKYKIINNPKFIMETCNLKGNEYPPVVLVWKNKKNSSVGGCTFSLLSICAISGETVIVQN